jgi:hypothetical protein
MRGWQRDARDAFQSASAELVRRRADTLGTTEFAMKAALMHRGPVVMAGPGLASPPVIMCNVSSGSYRSKLSNSCDLPGYALHGSYGPFRVLAASPASGQAR